MIRTIAAAGGLLGLALAAATVPVPEARAETKEINFGIISTESSQNLKTIWEPFLADMQRKTGYKVNPFFAADYAGVIQAMRFDKVDVAWFGNKSAMEAVDRAGGEIFAQTVDKDGNPGYWSLLIVHMDSPIQSLDDILKHPGEYTFGNGDPNSTSGFLVPSFYVFAQNKADPKTLFKRVMAANHETNALDVANRQVDVATNNTENMSRMEKTAPERAKEIRTIWKSPLIPSDPIVWRKNLPDAEKKAIRDFIFSYGVKGSPEEIAKEKQVLAGLQWAPFKESSNAQLIPIRQLELFRDRTKIENDASIAAEEKKAKLAEIDAKLQDLSKQQGS
jgi:phosphonate transport system substrate-binding protein